MKPKPWKLYKIQTSKTKEENFRCCGKMLEDDSGNLYPFLDPIPQVEIPISYNVLYFRESAIIKDIRE